MKMDLYPEVDEAISYIHQNIDEPLSLCDLASHIGYSQYHFARIFKGRTGLSPHYYIASLRLQKAKELLLKTDLHVRDIGLEIGQQSLGTFTTRFTERVGLTPGEFRKSVLQVDSHVAALRKLNKWPASEQVMNVATSNGCNIEGTVQAAVPFEGTILVGLFPKPIPEGLPIHGTLLPSPGNFSFANVKPGRYYLMATSVSWKMKSTDIILPNTTLRARLRQPIIVKSHQPVPHLHIILHPPQLDDPPILISLPLLMQNFLEKIR